MFSVESMNLILRAEKKPPNMRTEQEKIALMGRPRLGDVIRAQIRIKESKEFKVSAENGPAFALTIYQCHIV